MTRSSTLAPGPALSAPAARFSGGDLALYATTVLCWGTSWIALKAQVGVVAPEVSILWRFLLAALLMWGWALARGERLRFSRTDHLRFAAAGLCLFSLNFTLFYYGALTIPSGLLAVVFSLASIFNLGLGAVLLRQRIEPRVALGGLVGFTGIGLLFWPEIANAGAGGGALTGLAFCVGGTLSFCLGNMVSTVIQRRGVPLVSANTWAMTYGVGYLLLASLLRGHAFIVEPTVKYLASLVFLAGPASVVAFACYLTLLRRIGAARAGYATVLFPIVALAVSTLFEGYVWTGLAVLGAVLALLGNVIVLTRPAAK
ncbi:MAG TPA: DMT family transporter [Microvirga sp.]|jgi:drug/metabolite transporter (DMT)-like permease|nr:DMT family transporter [Microvirga sp.]